MGQLLLHCYLFVNIINCSRQYGEMFSRKWCLRGFANICLLGQNLPELLNATWRTNARPFAKWTKTLYSFHENPCTWYNENVPVWLSTVFK